MPCPLRPWPDARLEGAPLVNGARRPQRYIRCMQGAHDIEVPAVFGQSPLPFGVPQLQSVNPTSSDSEGNPGHVWDEPHSSAPPHLATHVLAGRLRMSPRDPRRPGGGGKADESASASSSSFAGGAGGAAGEVRRQRQQLVRVRPPGPGGRPGTGLYSLPAAVSQAEISGPHLIFQGMKPQQ